MLLLVKTEKTTTKISRQDAFKAHWMLTLMYVHPYVYTSGIAHLV